MVAVCNQLLENMMMLQFGGRNPEVGLNHICRCLDVYYLHYVS